MEEGMRFTNRLIHEKSPYLLQHAHNPVDWYPWGEEAFRASREFDKPIFLSIGYATCHWCHVMEKESFDDPEVASALNDAFIPIKIDREELPEIDALYMEFAQTMIVGSAGWPLNVILTPELKPFFAATYLPKHSTRGLVGVIELTKKIHELWKSEDRSRLIAQSDKVVDILKTHVHLQGSELPKEDLITDTAEILFKIADPIYGGMKGAPKFPLGYQAQFLLNYFLKSQDSRALFLAEKTLEMMYRGGIYDHIAGGFARYSVDDRWQIPHFEKMLYDNSILAASYLEAWRVTGRQLYKDVTEEILTYVLTEMTSPDGGFYSAEDADSMGVEGLFYTWKKEEIISALGPNLGELFCDFYNITEEGNFEGRSVPYMEDSLEDFASHRGVTLDEIRSLLDKAKKELFNVRASRPRPLKDDKIIVSWNGLMIASLASAGFYFQSEKYMQAAVKAARFIKNNLWKNGVLYRRFRDGDVRFRASLDDYAFLIDGLLNLFETEGSVEWLSWALELANNLEQNFKAEDGAFYQTDGTDENLLIRKCHFSDGAEPSGNAVHAENLIRLYQITYNSKFLKHAEDILKAAKRYIDAYPLGYCYHLIALQRYYDEKKATVLIACNQRKEMYNEIVDALCQKVLPYHCLVMTHKGDSLPALLPWVSEYIPATDITQVSICHEGACKLPVHTRDDILKAIHDM
jgi:uncharacterized protein